MNRPASNVSHAGKAVPSADLAERVSVALSTSVNVPAGIVKSIAVSSGDARSICGVATTGASFTGVIVSRNGLETVSDPSLAVTLTSTTPV